MANSPVCILHGRMLVQKFPASVFSVDQLSIIGYSCTHPDCNRIFIKEFGGYGEIGDHGKFIHHPEWEPTEAPQL